jgi:hypothetical protein
MKAAPIVVVREAGYVSRERLRVHVAGPAEGVLEREAVAAWILVAERADLLR